ncbi:Type II secretion system protein G precursor [Pelotomaculum schinkii]|uniref:Type II secretion system protein G n=1 Tax=Pelotomaculum schinkii TaxID=78350 RepID=A0A4Y7R7V1_9FIRM|nr:prepilin-type N-terminal cleavage/methylation domain-containing protein [Pelotomaculum schinkii]TEB04721.1 Type II secretion system protein G precursor [Pelotomaculum schinkii]
MFWRLANLFRRTYKNQLGFTLVELIVVVVILAILAAVMIPKLLPYTQQARVSRAEGDMATMKTIIESYAAEYGQGYYPKTGTPGTYSSSTVMGPGMDISVVLQSGGVQWTGASGGITDPWNDPYEYIPYTDGNGNVIGWSIQSAGQTKKSGSNTALYESDIYSPTLGTVPTTLTGSGGTAGAGETSNGATMP